MTTYAKETAIKQGNWTGAKTRIERCSGVRNPALGTSESLFHSFFTFQMAPVNFMMEEILDVFQKTSQLKRTVSAFCGNRWPTQHMQLKYT